MDPISQGTFGGIFSQFFSSKKKLTVATVIGIISGLAPDLDVFIKSSYDPLLSLEYHRQFTHSFIFIPFGALIVTLFTYNFVKKYITFFENYIFSFVGYFCMSCRLCPGTLRQIFVTCSFFCNNVEMPPQGLPHLSLLKEDGH